MTRLSVPIAPDHPAFDGHFPGRPILPGVVLLDASLRAVIAQVGAERAGRAGRAGRWHVAQAKFLSFVEPGCPVHVEFEPATGADRFRLRVLAGPATAERVAMTGSLAFVPDESTG